jgi:hypothetical protein
MNVALITTVNHNVGDDFVREGLVYFLKKRFGDFTQNLIDKHNSRKALIDQDGSNKILTADLVVQSGAPVYWLIRPYSLLRKLFYNFTTSRCCDAEWVKLLWYNNISKVCNKIPVANVAAGTCQPYYSTALEIGEDKNCRNYIIDIHKMCRFTTTRERLAHSLLNSLSLENQLLPCTSIFARDNLNIDPKEKELILFNYMKGGGHYGLGQPIDTGRWESTFFEVFDKIRQKHNVVIVLHNSKEYREVEHKVDRKFLFISKDYRDYLEVYSRGRVGIFNRVHAGLALASFCRPSLIIGTDTRVRMAEQMGLPHYFVNDVNAHILLDEFNKLVNNLPAEIDKLRAIKEMAKAKYLELFKYL